MINKELLSEVLEINVTYSEQMKNNIFRYYFNIGIGGDLFEEINIYELAHKCKEWATPLNSKYYLDIHVDGISQTTHIRKYSIDIMDMNSMDAIISFEATTEPEAIFKACEWILQQR
jgi:hypothetical protein